MKKIILYLIISTTIVFAQQSLNIQTNSLADAESSIFLGITIDVPIVSTPGFALSTSSDIYIVPVSVLVENKNFWLINDDQVPQVDSVVAWYENDGNFIFLFQENQLENTVQVAVSCSVTANKSEDIESKQISVHELISTGDSYTANGQIVSQSFIPSTISQ